METIKTLADIKANLAQLREEFQIAAQVALKEIFNVFFEAVPEVTAIKFRAYTIYFNDGNECSFSVYEPTFTNAPKEELDNVGVYERYDGDAEGVWAADDYSIKDLLPEEKAASCKELSSIIQSAEMQDAILSAFGDHVEVTVTREGFEVEEYTNHD